MAKKPKQGRKPSRGHPTLKALPKLKGGHYRRVKDIQRAFDELRVTELPPVVQFLLYFFGCEKLALAIVGVEGQFAAGEGQFVHFEQLKKAAESLKISITDRELDSILAPPKHPQGNCAIALSTTLDLLTSRMFGIIAADIYRSCCNSWRASANFTSIREKRSEPR